jgi:hypothetical protein
MRATNSTQQAQSGSRAESKSNRGVAGAAVVELLGSRSRIAVASRLNEARG